MASNSHGFSNETEMSAYLDNKKYNELNLTMKEFIKYIANTKGLKINENTLIKSEPVTNNKFKQDILISIDNNTYGISLKVGTGNSCHQEKIEDYISFITKNCNATRKICDMWRIFIWADGTKDGSGSLKKDKNGKIISRFDTKTYKEKYKKDRDELQKFLDNNKSKLIERDLFIGKYNSTVDFVYHGTYKQGRWISKDEIMHFLINKKVKAGSACFNLSSLTVQPWNASLKGNTEHKRGQIQIKYSTMKKDFDVLLKNDSDITEAYLGDSEEFDLSRNLNHNKNNKMWRTLLPNIDNFDNYYIIKISKSHFSKLSERNVKTKSDAYVVKATLDKHFLLKNEFVLDEGIIKDIPNEIVKNSGISIKLKNSKHFSYMKFTVNSFRKAFSELADANFWLISLLLYSDDKQMNKNKTIIIDLDETIDSYASKIKKFMKISGFNYKDSKTCDNIRKIAKDKIKNYILNNKELLNNIFSGRTWFDDPYYASFIYKNGEMEKIKIPDFSITPGAGRTHRKYTIEIKP